MKNFKFISALLISIGCIATVANSVNAQNYNSKDTDVFQSNEVDPLTGNSGFNPMDLIHNANLLNIRNSEEFIQDSNEQIDSAASDFRKQQLQRMLELQQQDNSGATTGNGDTTPTP